MKPDIYKVEQIENGVLAVMAKPVSGEWIDDEFLGIANAGINTIVSLLEPNEADEVGLVNEKILSENNGMKFISFPIKDRGLPRSVKEFGDFTKNLYDQISMGENTVIHCRAGIGRTGMVAAGILLHCGFNPEQAFKYVSLKRGVLVPDTEEQHNWVVENYSAIFTANT